MEQVFNCDFSDLFNQVVIQPLKIYKPEYEQMAINLKRELETEFFLIQDSNRLQSRFSLIYPAFECLKHNIEEGHKKNMLKNLVLKSLDKQSYYDVHPRFVTIIEQLTWQEEILFQYLNKNKKIMDFLICKSNLAFDKNRKIISYVLPQYVTNIAIDDLSALDISLAVNNLSNLGLIEISFVEWGDKEYYSELLQNKDLQEILLEYKHKYPHLSDLTIKAGVCGVIKITDFGINFAKTCL